MLLWLGVAHTPAEALELVASKRGVDLFANTLPSQRRYVVEREHKSTSYVQYFGTLMDGFRPNAEVITLKKITITGIPELEEGGFRPILEVWSWCIS